MFEVFSFYCIQAMLKKSKSNYRFLSIIRKWNELLKNIINIYCIGLTRIYMLNLWCLAFVVYEQTDIQMDRRTMDTTRSTWLDLTRSTCPAQFIKSIAHKTFEALEKSYQHFWNQELCEQVLLQFVVDPQKVASAPRRLCKGSCKTL